MARESVASSALVVLAACGLAFIVAASGRNSQSQAASVVKQSAPDASSESTDRSDPAPKVSERAADREEPTARAAESVSTGPANDGASNSFAIAVHRQNQQAAERIQEALQKRVSVQFKDQPLQEALRHLADAAGVILWIDEGALHDEAIEVDNAVTLQLSGETIEQGLNRLLPGLGLTWLVEDEVLKITTKVEAEELFETRVYDVQTLIDHGANESDRSSFWPSEIPLDLRPSPLREVIQYHTSGYWMMVNSQGGSVNLAKNILIVKQNYQVQREIAALLKALAQVAESKGVHPALAVRPAGYPIEADQRVYKALAAIRSVDFVDTGLTEVARYLAESEKIPVVVDKKALNDAGLNPHIPLTLRANEIGWNSIRHLMLEPIELTSVVNNGSLEITTRAATFERLSTVVYDVRDLVERGVRAAQVIDVIQNETTADWIDIHSTGGAIDEAIPGILVVRQTEDALQQVDVVLSEMRTRAAGSVESTQGDMATDGRLVTRFYSIDWFFRGGAVRSDEQSSRPSLQETLDRRATLQEAILEFVAPTTWKPLGGAGSLRFIGESLVVHNAVEVHVQLIDFLDNLYDSEHFVPGAIDDFTSLP